MDHKTAQRGGDSYTRGLQYDPQFLLYAWAARKSGWKADFFAWNVVVKTKTPQLIRHYEPIFWPRVDMYVDRAVGFAKHIATLPREVEDIVAMPGNPGQCRHCPFTILCDNPKNAKGLAATEFRTETYIDFENFRSLPVTP